MSSRSKEAVSSDDSSEWDPRNGSKCAQPKQTRKSEEVQGGWRDPKSGQAWPCFGALENVQQFWSLWDEGDSLRQIKPVKTYLDKEKRIVGHFANRFYEWSGAAKYIKQRAENEKITPSELARRLDAVRQKQGVRVGSFIQKSIPEMKREGL